MKETFKTITDMENYSISDLGRIINNKTGKEIKTSINGNGYVFTKLSISGKVKKIYVHQTVAKTFLEHIPNGHELVVDHISGNKTDNSLSNLRIVTTRENNSKPQERNRTSKFTGVNYRPDRNKWNASIGLNGKKIHLGTFDFEEEAARAYQKALASLN